MVVIRALWLLLAFAGLTLATTTLDAWASELFPRLVQVDSVLRVVLKRTSYTAPWWIFLFLALAVLLHPRRRPLLTGFAVCLGASFGLLHVLKFVVGRARPELELGAFSFVPFTWEDKRDAFPSGHVTNVVLLTVLCGIYFPRSRWLFVPVAIVTAFVRIVQERHFLSDTVGATGLVLVICYLATRLLPSACFGRIRWRDIWGGPEVRELPAEQRSAEAQERAADHAAG